MNQLSSNQATPSKVIRLIAYYKRVAKQEEKLQEIPRPKKPSQLPNVFSKQEIALLISSIENIKHKAMIGLIYSAGLRRSEVLNLRKKDILYSRKCIFVKGAKGKKDRYVMLSTKAEALIKQYLGIYAPQYWLFEGEKGEQYSESSIQQVFLRAKNKSDVNSYVTLHGLRHSFATHLLESNVPLVVISIKTTEVYLPISGTYMETIKSPLESIDFC